VRLAVPDPSLLVLVTASGADFARGRFTPAQLLRGQDADAVAARLESGGLAVVEVADARPETRAHLVALAREHDVPAAVIVLDEQPGSGAHRSPSALRREGFRHVHVLTSREAADAAEIVLEPLRADRRGETGPFDVIGDVHGCRAELEELLGELGYDLVRDARGRAVDAAHPAGRRVVLLGDLVDRGPDTPGVLRLAMGMVGAGHALAVCGNHEQKLVRALRGKRVTVTNGLARSLEQLAGESEEFRAEVERFCYDLAAHLVLDGGDLVVAHAGLPERYHGRSSGRVRTVALYGDTTGRTDEHGRPERYPWANDYRGEATVLYGHTTVPEAEWVNGTMCLDTGVVFGGKLSALRYPEREVVSVPARRTWYDAPGRLVTRERREPAKPAAVTTTILSTVVGSHAYGLATNASDVDRRGVFVVPADRFWRFGEPPASLEGPRPEELNWELGRFCELALRSNPTVLEVFVSDRVEVMTPLGEELRALLPHVLSRRVAQSYLRATSAQLVRARAAETTRWKQVMHSLRLLIVCRDLLRDGVLSIDATAQRERLLAVRAGELGWPEVRAWADGLRAEIDRTEGPLPEEPDTAVVEEWLVSVRRRTLEVAR
jgi:hypothetical protein